MQTENSAANSTDCFLLKRLFSSASRMHRKDRLDIGPIMLQVQATGLPNGWLDIISSGIFMGLKRVNLAVYLFLREPRTSIVFVLQLFNQS
jgi:hypothetical protein